MNDTGRLLRLKAKIIEQAERIAELETSERRRFAAMAVPLLLASASTAGIDPERVVAIGAVRIADALIAELDKSK
jgi:hypothetical protein